MSRREILREAAKEIAAEILDPTPVELPVGLKRPLTLREEMMQMVRQEVLSRTAEEFGVEVDDATVEKLDLYDLDPDLEPDWRSEFELQEMVEDVPVGDALTPAQDAAGEPNEGAAPADPSIAVKAAERQPHTAKPSSGDDSGRSAEEQ